MAEIVITHSMLIKFICNSCKEKQHTDCRGETWCDCQHRTDRKNVE